MCESTAYILNNGEEELFFEDVDSLENKNNQIELVDIFGETKEIRARIKLFSLVDHKILLEPF
jgi:predicted RNA-binding protein